MTLTAENPNLARTREFLAALEAMDIPRFLNAWADNGVQEQPYAPGNFPKRLDGKAAIAKQYGGLPQAFKSMRFPVKRLVGAENQSVVIAEFDGSVELKGGGRYDNHYIGVFEWNKSGQLQHYTEYFDPVTLPHGFPGLAHILDTDAQQAQALIENMAQAADKHDWANVRAAFADTVDVDYTSVAGGKPAVMKADELVAGWTAGLTHFKQTKHNFSDFAVSTAGDTATATFTGQATHLKADGTRWNCGGDYTYRLKRTADGFKVTAARFDMRWELGAR